MRRPSALARGEVTAIGFPHSIREVESLNKLLNEVAAELDAQEQEPDTSDEPADRGRAAAVKPPTVECALRHLIDELHQQAYGQPHRGGNGEGRALMEAVWAREIHFIAVMVDSEAETPEEYLAALIADGTLPTDYTWPWDTKRPGAV